MLRKANCGTERGQPKKGCFLCGTDGSNPSPSTGESGSGRGLPGEVIEVADCHHYAVLEQLAPPDGLLTKALVAAAGTNPG